MTHWNCLAVTTAPVSKEFEVDAPDPSTGDYRKIEVSRMQKVGTPPSKGQWREGRVKIVVMAR